MSADRDGNRSNPYKPDPAHCCEACVFGRGKHAPWCFAMTEEQLEDGQAPSTGAERTGWDPYLRAARFRLLSPSASTGDIPDVTHA